MTGTRGTRSASLGPARALLYGTLVVGTLDIVEVIVFVARRGIPPVRVLQSVASGLLGRGAYAGGAATAALGLLLHFCIAFSVVAAYQLAARRYASLARSPLPWGALYGIGVWLVMNLLVVPLSAAAIGTPTVASTVNGLLIHVLGIGVPSALFARAALDPASPARREEPAGTRGLAGSAASGG